MPKALRKPTEHALGGGIVVTSNHELVLCEVTVSGKSMNGTPLPASKMCLLVPEEQAVVGRRSVFGCGCGIGPCPHPPEMVTIRKVNGKSGEKTKSAPTIHAALRKWVEIWDERTQTQCWATLADGWYTDRRILLRLPEKYLGPAQAYGLPRANGAEPLPWRKSLPGEGAKIVPVDRVLLGDGDHRTMLSGSLKVKLNGAYVGFVHTVYKDIRWHIGNWLTGGPAAVGRSGDETVAVIMGMC